MQYSIERVCMSNLGQSQGLFHWLLFFADRLSVPFSSRNSQRKVNDSRFQSGYEIPFVEETYFLL